MESRLVTIFLSYFMLHDKNGFTDTFICLDFSCRYFNRDYFGNNIAYTSIKLSHTLTLACVLPLFASHSGSADLLAIIDVNVCETEFFSTSVVFLRGGFSRATESCRRRNQKRRAMRSSENQSDRLGSRTPILPMTVAWDLVKTKLSESEVEAS